MKKRDIIIVTICITTALICIVLTWWGNYKNDGVLSPDAFYSVLATFIGICATFIVGFQIASFVKIHETEQQIKKVQVEREKMQKEKERFQEEIDFLKIELSNAFTMLSNTTTDNFVKIFAQILAVVSSKIKGNAEVTLSRYQGLHKNLKSAKQKELLALGKFTYKLKKMDIPNDIEHYTEIMKLHLEILEILENSEKNQEQIQQ